MHYYDQDANPHHYEGKDGKPTTLREARKLNLLPSVTTIGSVVAKPQLERWKTQETLMYALPRTWEWEDGELKTLCNLIMREAMEAVYAKSEDGTAIHDVLFGSWGLKLFLRILVLQI